jgi:ABC-type transport system involved in multi-copper enzyme maturation permease subunit
MSAISRKRVKNQNSEHAPWRSPKTEISPPSPKPELKRSGAYVVMQETFMRALATRLLLVWIAAIFLLSINLPVLSLIISRLLPPDYEPTNLPFFIALSIPFVPLLPLVLGSTSITDEREGGTLMFILSNPITKSDFFLGRWAGLALSTSFAVTLGYGAASVFVYGANLAGYAGVSDLIMVAVALDIAMVGLALTISTITNRKTNALIAGIFLWFVMTQLFQYIIALAYNLSKDAIQVVYFVTLLNPAGVAYILSGLVGGGSSIGGANGAGALGYLGDAISEALTSFVGASNILLVLALVTVAWTAGLFLLGYVLFTKRDLFPSPRRMSLWNEYRTRYPHMPRNLGVAILAMLILIAGYVEVSSARVASSPYPSTVTVSGTVNPTGNTAIPLSIAFNAPSGKVFTASISPGGHYSLVLTNQITYNTTMTYRDLEYNNYYCGLGLLVLASHTNSTTFSATCPSEVPIGF